MEKFLAATRVQERFTQPFTVAYDSFRCRLAKSTARRLTRLALTLSLLGRGCRIILCISGSRSCISSHHGAAAKEAPKADGAGSKTSREADVANFAPSARSIANRNLKRGWLRWPGKESIELAAAYVTKTRLFANLTSQVPMMCFYVVKNAKLCAAEDGRGAAREHYPHHYHTTPLPLPTPHHTRASATGASP